MFPFLAAASLLSGGISALKGASQKKQANKIIEGNPFPTQTIPQSILDNKEMAKMRANEGLPSQQYQNAIKNIDRTSNAALRTAVGRRGGLGLVSTIQQRANDAKGNLDVADANARRLNQNQLMNVNNQVGQWENNVWDWNKRQKYIQTAAAARALMGAGNANFNQGLDRLVGGGLLTGDYLSNNGKYSPSALRGAGYGNNNPNVRYDESGNEYYVDPYTGQPIK